MRETAADYQQRAEQHRPQDPQQLRLEVLRLMANGLSTRDIAEAFKLQPSEVLNLLAAEGPRS